VLCDKERKRAQTRQCPPLYDFDDRAVRPDADARNPTGTTARLPRKPHL
jgi:hypothetical protein